ncbi:hypothetical protein TNCV_2408451 [Trichonephila clavipes]|nr:hypothetical protein TNCV_2408451 [Trichonephila clavipes]
MSEFLFPEGTQSSKVPSLSYAIGFPVPPIFTYERDYRPSRSRILLSRNRSSCAAEQLHKDASQETVGRRAPNNSKNWQWTPACDDRHLLRMAVNDRTASSRKLAARWSTTTGVLMSASSIRRCLLH